MASVRKRGARQWQAQVRKRGYPQETKTFETRAAAERWVRQAEHEMDMGYFVFARRSRVDHGRLQAPILS